MWPCYLGSGRDVVSQRLRLSVLLYDRSLSSTSLDWRGQTFCLPGFAHQHRHQLVLEFYKCRSKFPSACKRECDQNTEMETPEAADTEDHFYIPQVVKQSHGQDVEQSFQTQSSPLHWNFAHTIDCTNLRCYQPRDCCEEWSQLINNHSRQTVIPYFVR